MKAIDRVNIPKLERLIVELKGTQRALLGLQDAAREAAAALREARHDAASHRLRGDLGLPEAALVAYGDVDEAQAFADALADLATKFPQMGGLRDVQRSFSKLIAAHRRASATREAVNAAMPSLREQGALVDRLKAHAVVHGWVE